VISDASSVSCWRDKESSFADHLLLRSARLALGNRPAAPPVTHRRAVLRTITHADEPTMNRTIHLTVAAAALSAMTLCAFGARADICPVSHGQLKTALVSAANADSTGLNNNYWGVVVNRQGEVCAVAYSGPSIGSQWLLSRQIAAAKAFTTNGLSLDGAPVATAALYSWVLPVVPQGNPGAETGPAQNPLFGLNGGNVLDSEAAYRGRYDKFGSANDPMVGERVGGTITFGGGLGLFSGGTSAVGGLGLSGDTACAAHSTAWRTRANLLLAPTPGTGFDTITLGTTGHPHCPNDGGTQGQTP
jgi:hypothetical protein